MPDDIGWKWIAVSGAVYVSGMLLLLPALWLLLGPLPDWAVASYAAALAAATFLVLLYPVIAARLRKQVELR